MYQVFESRSREYISLYETESTNNDLKSVIRKSEEPVFAVISAKKQTTGRGRLGRSFASPEGGLYFSASFPLTGEEKNIPFLTLLSGLAVSEAIEELTGVGTRIKWPNDIYLGGKKLGGILTELVFGKEPCAVVGIGINLYTKRDEFPGDIRDKATSFVCEGLALPDEKALLSEIISRLEEYVYGRCELYNVSEHTMEKIRKRSYSLGRHVKYTLNDTVLEGIVTDIKSTGAAEITLADGSKREIFCGEII